MISYVAEIRLEQPAITSEIVITAGKSISAATAIFSAVRRNSRDRSLDTALETHPDSTKLTRRTTKWEMMKRNNDPLPTERHDEANETK